MKDREKEIKYLIYLKGKLIRDTKKEIKQLNNELRLLSNKKKVKK